MIPFRTPSLAALAVAGTAAWAWSQQPAPVQITDELEIRATAEPVQSEFPIFPTPRGGLPSATNSTSGFAFSSSENVNGSVGTAGPATPGYRVVTRPRTVMETYYITLQPEEVAEQKEMQGLIEVLHSDKPVEEKEKAKASLNSLLQKQFTRDVERREKEVAELEERVKKLRNQLDKRKDAKDKIISLRLTTIQNEAEGLGFPEEGRHGSGTGLNLFEKPVAPMVSPYGVAPLPVPSSRPR